MRPQHGTSVQGERCVRSIDQCFPWDSDVNKFFFFFEHVVMLGKNEERKSLELSSHVDGEEFDFFFQRFMDDKGDLLPEEQNYLVLKAAFLEKFEDKAEPREVIRRAMESRLHPIRL